MKFSDVHAVVEPLCRSPYGERGLKLARSGVWAESFGRSPYGERGLKWVGSLACIGLRVSLSLRRAWIEIAYSVPRSWQACGRSPYGERGLKCVHRHHETIDPGSLSLRRAWIEINMQSLVTGDDESLSLRRAWIEIP